MSTMNATTGKTRAGGETAPCRGLDRAGMKGNVPKARANEDLPGARSGPWPSPAKGGGTSSGRGSPFLGANPARVA